MFFLEKAYFFRKSRSSGASTTNRTIPLSPLDSPDFSESPSILFVKFGPGGTKNRLCSFVPTLRKVYFPHILHRVIISGTRISRYQGTER